MLTGKRPYEGEAQVAIAIQHINEPIPRLPPDLKIYQPLIDKMMAKGRMERLYSSAEFLRLLDRVLKRSIKTTPSPIEASPDKTAVFPSIPSPPSKTTEKEFTFIKPTEDEDKQPLFNKYFNVVDKKLRALFKDKSGPLLKEKQGSFKEERMTPSMKATKKKLYSLKNYPIHKKLIFGIIPVVILVISFIIFGPGSESILNPPVSSISVDQYLTRKSSYYIDLNLVLDLYNKRDIESQETALTMINNLKKTTPGPELNQLEKRINHRIEELDKEFEIYLTSALDFFNRKKLSKARENLLQDKQIKTTEQLKELEDVIEKKMGKSKKKKDDLTLTDD
jgi:hypothetical protein